MNWINKHGLIFIIILMISNIIFAVKNKDGFENLWNNRAVETLEQIGRFLIMIKTSQQLKALS